MSAIDWREPMIARAEEMTQEVDGVTDPRLRHAILWHLGTRGYARVLRKEACYQCLATFPAPPSRETMPFWEKAEREGWTHVRPKAIAHRFIREQRCPVCGAPITDEALKVAGMGRNPDDERIIAEQAEADEANERREFEARKAARQ